jgi:tRNA(adenine34) deaminase
MAKQPHFIRRRKGEVGSISEVSNYKFDWKTWLLLLISSTINTMHGDQEWMRLALIEAGKAAELGEVPVGAVAVFDGRIIGSGFNRKESDQDPTAHAEMIALRQAAESLDNWRLIGVTLYCTLEPCPMCAGAMIQARLERLVYGAVDTRFGADGTVVDVLGEPAFNHRVEVTCGVLADEAGELLQQFFRTLREK